MSSFSRIWAWATGGGVFSRVSYLCQTGPAGGRQVLRVGADVYGCFFSGLGLGYRRTRWIFSGLQFLGLRVRYYRVGMFRAGNFGFGLERRWPIGFRFFGFEILGLSSSQTGAAELKSYRENLGTKKSPSGEFCCPIKELERSPITLSVMGIGQKVPYNPDRFPLHQML